MKTALFLSAIALLQTPASESVTYNNEMLGLSFNHPKTWQVTTKKGETKALIPLEGTAEKALLEIYPVAFASETDVWQLSQAHMLKTMKRELVRQWSEEILGVPLLLTRTNFVQNKEPKTSIIGLIYSRTPKKMMYKLTASPEEFDKALFEWQSAMQTLRTFDGKLPVPEDPTNKLDPTKVRTPIVPDSKPPKVITSLTGRPTKKAPNVLQVTVAARKLELRYPAEWAAKVDDSGVVIFEHPDLSAKLTVSLASTLDSDPPARALFAASSKSLSDFKAVAKRDETLPTRNTAGAEVGQVWRTGTGGDGFLVTCDAVGYLGDFYFLMHYRSNDQSKSVSERKAIEALLDQMSLELAP